MTTTHESPSFGDVIGDVLDLVTGGITALLPAVLLGVPCFALVLAPLMVVGLVLAVIGALLVALAAPPFLLVRSLRRRRRAG
jgi:type IV secretory pathway VirB3-like protein